MSFLIDHNYQNCACMFLAGVIRNNVCLCFDGSISILGLRWTWICNCFITYSLWQRLCRSCMTISVPFPGHNGVLGSFASKLLLWSWPDGRGFLKHPYASIVVRMFIREIGLSVSSVDARLFIFCVSLYRSRGGREVNRDISHNKT